MAVKEHEFSCVGCDCTDSCACAEGCSWVIVREDKMRGICSVCRDAIKYANPQRFRSESDFLEFFLEFPRQWRKVRQMRDDYEAAQLAEVEAKPGTSAGPKRRPRRK